MRILEDLRENSCLILILFRFFLIFCSCVFFSVWLQASSWPVMDMVEPVPTIMSIMMLDMEEVMDMEDTRRDGVGNQKLTTRDGDG